jgi:hypothetical protein
VRNTAGGIRAITPRIIQLTPDVAPSATKTARAHDDQSALNDHRAGGYEGKDIMS